MIIAWVITAGLLTFLLLTIDLDVVFQAWSMIPLGSLFMLCLGEVLFTLGYESFTLRLLFAKMGSRLRWGALVVAKGISFIPNIINYSAGGLYIAWFLKEREGYPLTRSLGYLLFQSVTDVAALSLLILACHHFVPVLIPLHLHKVTIITGLVIIGMITLWILFWRVEPWLRVLHPLRRRSLFHAFRLLRTGDYLLFIILRMILMAGLAVFYFLVLCLFQTDISLAHVLALYPIVIFIGALPLSISGIGSTQVAAVVLFSGFVSHAFDATEAASVITAFTSAFIATTLLFRVLIGLGMMFFKRILI